MQTGLSETSSRLMGIYENAQLRILTQFIHFACVSDSDMNVKREDQFPWPLTIEFFERAYEPLDWKYQVYVKSRKEFKHFKRYALIYGLGV